MNKKQLGAEGEQFVCSELQHQKFMIIEQNWRCRFGEIDIVAKKEHTLYFIEVRTRTKHEGKEAQFGQAIEALNYYKIRKLHQLAQLYCYYKHYHATYLLLFAPVTYYPSQQKFELEKLINI